MSKRIIVIKLISEEFNNEDQHDSHEFLIWLLDNLNETLKIENKKLKKFEGESVYNIKIIL